MTGVSLSDTPIGSSSTPYISPSQVQAMDKQQEVSVLLPALLLLEMEDDECTTSDEELSSGSSSASTSPRKAVGFSNVEVREYAITVGDHPCCSQGCALTLDWDYNPTATITALDTYEASRAPRRRHRDNLRTSWEERRRILSQEGGCSEGELRKAQRKLHRARSCNSRLCEKMSESFFRDE